MKTQDVKETSSQLCPTVGCGDVRKGAWGLSTPPEPQQWAPPELGAPSSSAASPPAPIATRHHWGQGIRTADFSKNLPNAAATAAVFLQSKQNMTLVNSAGLLKL